MKARFRKGMLVVTLPVIDPPKKSKSGKTLLVATTRGVRRTALKHDGKSVHVNANAFIRPDEQHHHKTSGGAKSKARRKGGRSR